MALDSDVENIGKEEELETPLSLIIQEFPENIFYDDNTRSEFEMLFQPFGDPQFIYLPGFRRIIVNFHDSHNAVSAEETLHGQTFKTSTLKMSYKQEAKQLGEPFLKLPQAEKLFLISPPASPPVGWTQKVEPIPVVNYDLLTAVAGLEMPGTTVELVERTDSTPGIVVEGCENPEPLNNSNKPTKNINALPRHEVQTKRPPVT